MDAITKMFSSSKTKTNVSLDGGAPDTVGTAVAHTPVGNAQTPAPEVPESTALDSSMHRDSAVQETKSGVGAPPPEGANANPPDEGRTLEGAGRDLPCFTAGRQTVEALRHRFQPQLGKRQCARFVDDLISNSLDHWTTTCYDRFQRCWLGIM